MIINFFCKGVYCLYKISYFVFINAAILPSCTLIGYIIQTQWSVINNSMKSTKGIIKVGNKHNILEEANRNGSGTSVGLRTGPLAVRPCAHPENGPC